MSLPPNEMVNGWYAARALFPGVWSIESKGAFAYLVAGSERALLIDTAWGVGDLAALARALTPLPLVVINTHGHIDHVSGDYQFPTVWIDADDLPLTARAVEMRPRVAERWQSETWPEGYSPEAWLRNPPPTLAALPAGTDFPLGGRTLRVLRVPGHTPGSLALLDVDARLLFAGDSITRSVLLQLPDSLPLSRYAASMRLLLDQREAIEYILSGHSAEPLPRRLLEDILAAAEAILAGELVGVTEMTRFGESLVARRGEAVINYLADRL